MNNSFDYLKNIFESALPDTSRGDYQNGLDADQFPGNINGMTDAYSWKRVDAGILCTIVTWPVSQGGRAMHIVR
jgi:xylose isomerase